MRQLVEQVAHEDGRDPLSDQAHTQLGSSEVRHAIARGGDTVVGYAQRDGASLEIVALPEAVGPLLDALGDADVRVWSHGRRLAAGGGVPGARAGCGTRAASAADAAARRDRRAAIPDGVDIRPFVPGRDEDAWVEVNAAAFAHHPEQGRWTRADLEAREREPWFDPSGFLMAWRGSELAGFHWTKIHPDGAGEVYVIAVAPSAQGLGLGRVLLDLGLVSLYRRGCREVLLYVDGDNTGAMRLYERTGFRPHDLDVQWSLPS